MNIVTALLLIHKQMQLNISVKVDLLLWYKFIDVFQQYWMSSSDDSLTDTYLWDLHIKLDTELIS